MRMRNPWFVWVSVVSALCVGGREEAAGETAAIVPETPWRVYLVHFSHDKRKRDAKPSFTAMPPAAWTQADFDDSGWGRYSVDLQPAVGGYGCGQSAATAVLCMRTRFGIQDPAAVRDLALSLEYRGGVAVYVNGQEVARQNLPAGALDAAMVAEEFPPEAFKDAGGTVLPATDRPAKENAERYEKRVRKLTVTLPAAVLRRGSNALALQLHATEGTRGLAGGKSEWSGAGLCEAKLASPSGAGVIAYADAVKGATIWNASPMETIAVTPGKFQSGFLWWGITITPMGLTQGNPFEPLQPIRTVAPRGGTCSGQVVVSAPGPLNGLKAAIGPLTHASGKTLPAASVQVRYAMQEKDEVFCNALMPQPVEGAAVQPVWVLVDVPRDQQPGWYTGELNVSAGGASARAPVQVWVAGWTVTDPRDNATLVSLYQSPDTLAEYYKVEPWSDRHFALIEKSMQSVAKIGNDVLLAPVILDNYLHHKNGLVRWVRKGNGWEPEFSAFERYLDLHSKIFGKPKVITLSIWKHDFGTRAWFRGMKSDAVKPCMVTEYDPATKTMKPMQAPHFGEPGSEEFWKTMVEGVRRIVKARGVDDRFLLLGEAFDSRPLQSVVDFFQKIEPGMRWQIYAHWVGDPPPKDGKLIAQGGFETGFRISPGGGALPEFDRDYASAATDGPVAPGPLSSVVKSREQGPKMVMNEFYSAGAGRCEIHHTSSPLSYRMVMRGEGTLARIGLDFWTVMTDDRGRRRGWYGCPPNEGWLWRGHTGTLTAPGPDGAVITTRGQMLMEGLQETEALVALIRARRKASPELVKRVDGCLGARGQAGAVGGALSQAMISMDLLGLAAREYAVAADLAGTPGSGDWDKPPVVTVAGGAP